MFLAFKNGIVKITKQDVEFKKYSSVEAQSLKARLFKETSKAHQELIIWTLIKKGIFLGSL